MTCIQEKRVREAIDIASSLQKALSRLQKEMSVEILRKKELLELAELDNVPKKQIELEKKELKAYKHKGVHITVNTLKELEEAEQNINRINQVFGAQ